MVVNTFTHCHFSTVFNSNALIFAICNKSFASVIIFSCDFNYAAKTISKFLTYLLVSKCAPLSTLLQTKIIYEPEKKQKNKNFVKKKISIFKINGAEWFLLHIEKYMSNRSSWNSSLQLIINIF